jgi:hypothetical protein
MPSTFVTGLLGGLVGAASIMALTLLSPDLFGWLTGKLREAELHREKTRTAQRELTYCTENKNRLLESGVNISASTPGSALDPSEFEEVSYNGWSAHEKRVQLIEYGWLKRVCVGNGSVKQVELDEALRATPRGSPEGDRIEKIQSR